jgi:hypothetical protein
MAASTGRTAALSWVDQRRFWAGHDESGLAARAKPIHNVAGSLGSERSLRQRLFGLKNNTSELISEKNRLDISSSAKQPIFLL